MQTYALSDVHAHLIALDAVLNHIKLQPNDTFIALGDYIDRGPDSKGVLDRLIQLQSQCNLIPLLGNHEEMLLAAKLATENRGDIRAVAEWLLNGGDAALESYNPVAARTGSSAMGLHDIPQSHWDFISKTCRDYYETPTHIFVHAGADYDIPMDAQDPHTLRWMRFNDPPPHVSGKHLICGHTPQRSGFPRHIGHATCLDTGIHVGRYLTCLHINTHQIIQANPQGQLRTSMLNDHLVTPNPM